MSELKIDFSFTQGVLNNANEVQNEVDQILGEIKSELDNATEVGPDGVGAVELSLSVASKNE